MNERNLGFIRPYNLSAAKEIADNKLLTKRILEDHDIPAPALIGQINDQEDLRDFNWEKLPNSFVMKPVKGLEGAGIGIFYNRDKNGDWIKSDGSKASVNDLKRQAHDILDGKYSLHNQKDSVFFEERVQMHKDFKYYAYKGAPDVRVLIFNNIPIMSYVRLPTKESDGKGNLAQGAIGAAIDLVTGTTTHAIIGKSKKIETIPGTKLSVSGLKIPYWNKILKMSIQVQRATNLGFAAIDFLIDRELGPVVIEMNARPGLSIQLANQDSLRWRLKKAAGIKVKTIEKGIRVAKDLFGGQIEEEIEKVSGKQIVSHIEPVEVISEDSSKTSALALIDTSRRTTTIEEKLAKKVGIIDPEMEIEDTTVSDITFNLAGNIITTDCRIVKTPIRGYKLLIGRKDLGDYLVDIRRVITGDEAQQKEALITAKAFTDPEKIDSELAGISKTITIVRYIRPINLTQEKKKFKGRKDYNPQFEYAPVDIDTDKILDRLQRLRPDTSTNIGQLFKNKIDELKKELFLLEAIGEEDRFTKMSQDLYGQLDEKVFKKALEFIKTTPKTEEDRSEKVLSLQEVKLALKQELEKMNFKGEIEFTKNGPAKASITKGAKKIRINSEYKFTPTKLKGTIAHEIGVHVHRAIKGAEKKYEIFVYGTAGYLEIEEGLAIWNKARVLNNTQPIRNAALLYISAYKNQTGSFTETYKYFLSLGISADNAFRYTYRTKRGLSNTEKPGALLKDSVYYTGYLKVGKMTDDYRQKLLDSGKTHAITNSTL